MDAGCAHGVCTFAHVVRDGTHGVFAEGGDVRHDHDAHHKSGGEGVEGGEFVVEELEEDGLKEGGDGEECEVPEYDRGDGGEELERGLEDFADAAWGVFAEPEGDNRADGDREEDGDEGGAEGAGNEGEDAVLGVVEERGPLAIG